MNICYKLCVCVCVLVQVCAPPQHVEMCKSMLYLCSIVHKETHIDCALWKLCFYKQVKPPKENPHSTCADRWIPCLCICPVSLWRCF